MRLFLSINLMVKNKFFLTPSFFRSRDMEVTFSLQPILRDNHIDQRGVILDLASHTGIPRNRVSAYYRGLRNKISLDDLGKLCAWLVEQGVDSARLPGALFTSQRSSLRDALFAKRGTTIYIGEYISVRDNRVTWRWVSRRDMAVVSAIMNEFSTGSSALNLEYVPFSYSPDTLRVSKKQLRPDIRMTKKFYDNIASSSGPEAAVVVGSQKSNHLLEMIVADIFSTKPFEPCRTEAKVPFFCVYRDRDPKMPSCFGGAKNPFSTNESARPGIHYINEKNQWAVCPMDDQSDAGIVISSSGFLRQDLCMLQLFGFTGKSSQTIGQYILQNSSEFWPPTFSSRGRELGVYICKIKYLNSKKYDIKGEIRLKSFKTTPLSEDILTKVVS